MGMNTFFVLSLLAPSQVWGGIAFLLLFAICFILVHAVKLSTLGYKALHDAPIEEKEPPKPEKKTQKPPAKRKRRTNPAPVYYLVEKKRVKTPPEEEYAEPKRIRFANGGPRKEEDYEDDYV